MEEIELIKDIITSPNADTLRYKIELLEKMHTKLQNDMYGKSSNKTHESTSVSKKPDTKKEVPYYINSDNVDMLI